MLEQERMMIVAQKFKSLGAALLHYFKQEPNAYTAGAREIIDFRSSMSKEEQAAAKLELESYGYEFDFA